MRFTRTSHRVVCFFALSLCAASPTPGPDAQHAAEGKAPGDPATCEIRAPEQKPTVPPALAKKIDAAFTARGLPAAAKPAYEKNFADSYRTIITSPQTTTGRSGEKDDPGLLGFNDGIKAAKHDAPLPLAEFSAIFEALGYKKQTITGVYTAQFEQSDFVTDADHARWWLDSTPYSGAVSPGHISVTALVSPKGTYGHFGSYEHHILILEVQAK